MTTASSAEAESGESATASEVLEAVETATTGADEAHVDATPAESSTAAKDEKRSLLDVVKKASANTAKAGAASGTETKQGTEGDATAGDRNSDGTFKAKAKDAVAEGEPDDSKLPFHQHPRWKQVLGERNEARTQLDAITRERDDFKPDAEQHRQVKGFMDTHHLTPDEAADGFVVMALLKNDPIKALERLGPIVDKLRSDTGEVLTKDLQDKVEAGAIDEETAKELSRTRARDALGTRRLQAVDTQRQQQDVQRQATELNNTMASAVSAWEREIAPKDPDWSKKSEMVQSEALALIQRHGRPKSADDAVKLTKTAYENVNKRLKSILPQQREIRAGARSSDSGSTSTTAAQPKTLADAVRQAAGRR